MGIQATVQSLLAKSAGNSAIEASRLRASPDFNQVAAANGLNSLQRQVDVLVNALKLTPAVQDFRVVDPNGALIGWLGSEVVAGASYEGAWFKNLYVGGSDATTAPFFSDGTQVAIGKNGQVFVLDPFGNIGAWLGTQSETAKAVTGAVENGSGAIRLTVTAHGWVTGDEINAAAVSGVPNATGQWVIAVPSVNTLDLIGSTFAGTYSGGGTAQRFFAGGLFSTIAVGGAQRISGVTNNGSGAIRVKVTANGYATGYAVVITGVQGVPNINGESWPITVIDADHFDLVGSIFSGSYTGGGLSLNWPTAKLIARDDGSLTINGATITLNANGVTTKISNAPGGVTAWPTQATSLISIDNATGALAEVDPFHIALTDGFNFPLAYFSNNAGNGDVTVSGAVNGSPNPSTGQSFTIDAPTATMTLSGGGVSHPRGILAFDGLEFKTAPAGLNGFYDRFGVFLSQHGSTISTNIAFDSTVITDGAGNTVTVIPSNVDSPGFSAGGIPGITTTLTLANSLTASTTTINYGASLTVNTGNAVVGVSGVPGLVVSSSSFVTGVSLNIASATVLDAGTALVTTNYNFTKGLLTS